MKLTNKQERFCQEYVIDLNATQAAIRAGYSEKTAGQIGEQNLKKLEIDQRIKELQKSTVERLEITQENVIKDLFLAREIALGLKPHHVIVTEKDQSGATITTSKELSKTDVNAFIKLNDMLMKHTGMFEKDNHQKKTDVKFDASVVSTEELLQRAKLLGKLDDDE